MGLVANIERQGTNKVFTINNPIAGELKVDQSVAHNGVCLTVVEVSATSHKVVAVEETLKKSNLGSMKIGDKINIE